MISNFFTIFLDRLSRFNIERAKTRQDCPTAYNAALDGLRGLAVVIVLWSHATDLGIPSTFLLNLEGTGRYGVFLFFVLSAYLLSRQILTASNDDVYSVIYWVNYAMRRFLRILTVNL